jgi:hypothetical protein
MLTLIGFVTGVRRQLYLLGPTEYTPPEDGKRVQSPKRHVLNKK